MGRYTGSKAKINRALGMLIYENNGAAKALERRDTPPGMHVRRGKMSYYGQAMLEKKKIKHFYGLHERQLRRFFAIAARQTENTGVALLVLCERRLDNVVRRASFTKTRPQARQGINHGHFQVNGRRVDIASYLVAAGDVVTVCQRPNVQALYRDLAAAPNEGRADWISFEPDALRAQVNSLPNESDVSLPVEVNRVVELLSR
jgi:small subunit ribosomal protein S4